MAEQFPGITHAALTVRDLEVSVPWYKRLVGADPVMDEDTGPYHHVVWALDGGSLLSIHKHTTPPAEGDRFDELRLGLDHLAFGVPDRAALEKCQRQLDELGIAHGGIIDAHYGSALSFRDPDNNALEFFAPPSS